MSTQTLAAGATAIPPTSPEDVLPLLHHVPDHHRVFDLPQAKAALSGMTPDLLARLVEIGLPYRDTPEGRAFDRYDLDNVALYSGRPSLQRMAMRSWRSALSTLDRPGGVPRRVLEYRLNDASQTDRPMTVATADQGVVQIPRAGAVLWRQELSPPPPPARLPEPLRSLMAEEMDGLRFFMLREGLRWNLEFVRQTGLAECGGASKLLVAAAKARGLTARHAFGLILAEPYATPHFWAEFLVGDEWVAADPMLIRVLTTACGLDPTVWSEHRSPGGALLRLTDVAGYDAQGRPLLRHITDSAYRLDPIVTAGDEDIATSFSVILAPPATSERKTHG